MSQFDISVIVPTYNRCDLLRDTIDSVVQQDAGGIRIELIIVDNNSTDSTKNVVEEYISGDKGNIRYIFEKRQGSSYARNAGIQAAHAPILAFLDDDVHAQKDWIRNIQQGLHSHPDVVYLGGRVLPQWEMPVPEWVKPNLAPLALQDYGPTPRYVSNSWPVCLVSANLACRREAFTLVGMFDIATQLVKNRIGSMEDHEWQMRVWAAGLKGIYVPDVAVSSPISKDRLTKNYHRRWYFLHGHRRAVLRDPQFERAAWRLFDVPAHVYRKLASHFFSGLKLRIQGGVAESFRQECFGLDCLGFIWHRLTHYSGGAVPGEHETV